MDAQARALIAWAVQELRELNDTCINYVIDYYPFDSMDHGKLDQLEKLAAGSSLPDPEDKERTIRELRIRIDDYEEAIGQIHEIAADMLVDL